MSLIEITHGNYVHSRRVRVLCDHLAEMIPQAACVLDVGCGDGLLASLIQQKRPDIEIRGIDVLARSQTHIPVNKFDGQVMPCRDSSYDAVMFVDVLHHTEDPLVLLREAVRVARQTILIKDHTLNGLFAESTLRFMDQVGNKRYGVTLPYNYWSQQKWLDAINNLGLKIRSWKKDLKLYPPLADRIFGRSLHFVAKLDLSQV